jgi:hypothetical protein
MREQTALTKELSTQKLELPCMRVRHPTHVGCPKLEKLRVTHELAKYWRVGSMISSWLMSAV